MCNDANIEIYIDFLLNFYGIYYFAIKSYH